jgi:hypothetical protein
MSERLGSILKALPINRSTTLDSFQPRPGMGDLCNDCGFQNVEEGKPPCLAMYPDLTRRETLQEVCGSYRPLDRLKQRRSDQTSNKPPLGFHNVRQVHTFPDSK